MGVNLGCVQSALCIGVGKKVYLVGLSRGISAASALTTMGDYTGSLVVHTSGYRGMNRV